MRATLVALLCGCGRQNFAAYPPACEELAFVRTADIAAFGPRNVALGDVNLDGDLDVVLTNGDAQSISVALGNGDGTFRSPMIYPAGVHPWSLAVARFAQGVPPDIVVGNYSDDTITVFRNDGTGALQPASTHGVLTPQALALADFDGDDHADVAVASFSADEVTVIMSDLARDFVFTAQTFATGVGPYSIATDDLDEDGNLDLLLANKRGTSLSSLLGNGDGTFRAEIPISTGLGTQPWHVTTADLDGDGHRDAIVADNYGTSSILIFRGRGDGTFAAPEPTAAPYNTWWIVAADMTADDTLDLVAGSGPDGVSTYVGRGDGTFEPRQDFAPQEGEKLCIAVGDLDHDRRPDVVSANGTANTVSVLLNRCARSDELR